MEVKPRKEFKGFSYNCVVNRAKNEVYSSLVAIRDDHGPFKFGVLTESNQYDDEISDAFPGYREVCYRKGGLKNKNTRLLIKKKWYERLEVKFITCNEPWRGPKGGLQPGRVFPVAILGRGKNRLVIISIHLAWDGDGKNNKAVEEERHLINNYITSLPETYSVLAPGDWNRGEQAIKNYIHADGWEVLPGTNKGVDHTGAILVSGTSHHGDRYGSDHPLQLIEAECD